MKNNPLRAFLLVVLVLGSTMLVYVPTSSSQLAAVSFSIEVADASVQLDVRPGSSGVGCTSLIVRGDEISEDQNLKQGDRIGIIRFGSRADIYFENYIPLVKVNQKTIAGETLLAKR